MCVLYGGYIGTRKSLVAGRRHVERLEHGPVLPRVRLRPFDDITYILALRSRAMEVVAHTSGCPRTISRDVHGSFARYPAQW